jgi:hypothetical protein
MARRKRKTAHWRKAFYAMLREQVLADLDTRDPLPDLSEEQILAWADAHFARLDKWPTTHSGLIPEAPGETWLSVEAALCLGLRGLPGGSSIARFLKEHRGRYHRNHPHQFTIAEILAWVDDYHRRTGDWPTTLTTTSIDAAGGKNWKFIDYILRAGRCGLPGGSSLAQLLAERRGVPNHLDLPNLTEEQILAWSDAHHERTGLWPIANSGVVFGSHGETWSTIENALRFGVRGMPGGSSLAQLLARRRGVPNRMRLLHYKETTILGWAKAHRRRTGNLPTRDSGAIPEAPRETWQKVDAALRVGARGLQPGSSLARFLVERLGLRDPANLPPFTTSQILAWADAYHQRTGAWPKHTSGSIPEAPGETWSIVQKALYVGGRGLPAGDSLAALLTRERGARKKRNLPALT